MTFPFYKAQGRGLRFCVFVIALVAVCGNARAEPPVTPNTKPYAESYVGEMGVHVAAYEDTLVKVARDYDLGFTELRGANPGVDPWLPGEGIRLVLPSMHLLPQAPHEGIVINLPETRLYVFAEPGQPPVTHPIGVGREGLATPVGRTTVVRKKIGPVWRPTERMRQEDPTLPESIGPGKDNPMGTHALYLGWPQYALHGTNKPYGIGRRVSSGCIRMYPEDIVTMFDIVPEGMTVTVVDQPIKVGWIGNELYMEAHPSLDQTAEMEQDGMVTSYEFTEDDQNIIVREAGDDVDLIDWNIVRRIVRTRSGVPEPVAARPEPPPGKGAHLSEDLAGSGQEESPI